MSFGSSSRFAPYLIVIFFAVLSLIYTGWLYVASISYSGSVSSVEHGKGIYKRYPVDTKISSILPFNYTLKIRQEYEGWSFILELNPTLDNIEEVNLNLMSPVTNKFDQHIAMIKQKDNTYRALIECKEGQWDIEILVELNNQVYIISERIFLHDKNFINESVKQH
ncbi:MAG: FixH family protein [Candidatus Midichloria sp.]|nr:FixH family protein [Candidatus Midichloria sp.]